MSTQLYAQPYDLSANGFYFEAAQEYEAKTASNRNDYGEPVEEYEIQFINGETMDAELFKALGVHQGSVCQFLETAPEWEDWEKINIIIASRECGYEFDIETDHPDHFGITVYHVDSLRELAIEFVNDGLFGEIPERLQHYIDYDALARDLAVEYSETVIAGTRLIYDCS